MIRRTAVRAGRQDQELRPLRPEVRGRPNSPSDTSSATTKGMPIMISIHRLLRIYNSDRLPLLAAFYGIAWVGFLVLLWGFVPPSQTDDAAMGEHWLAYVAVQLTVFGTLCFALQVVMFRLDGYLSEHDIQALPDTLRARACSRLQRQASSPVSWSEVRRWGDVDLADANRSAFEAEQRAVARRQRSSCAHERTEG